MASGKTDAAINSNAGWASVTVTNGTGTINFCRFGSLRALNFSFKPTNTGVGIVAGTLPAGDRPAISVNGSLSAFNLTVQSEITIGTDGKISVNVPTNGGGNFLKTNITYSVV